MTKNNPPILLTEAFPYWLSGKGIFSEMENPPWDEVVDADLLDLDYFGNHSGWKKCSPLLYKLLDSDYTLSDTNREKLAALVMAKFGPNWTALWNTYHTEYDPLQDFSITETGSSTGQQAKTKSLSHTGSENTNDTSSVTYGKSVATSETLSKDDDVTTTYGKSVGVSETRAMDDDVTTTYGKSVSTSENRAMDDDVTTTYGKSVSTSETNAMDDDVTTTYGKSVSTSETNATDDDVTTTFGGTVSVMGNNSATNTQSKWGFNSADDVPTDKTVGTGNTSESTLHGGSDSSQRDISELKSGSETQSGSDSSQRDISELKSGSETQSGSDSSQRDISELKSGSETQSGSDSSQRDVSELKSSTESQSGSDTSRRDISELSSGSETQSGSDSTQGATTKQQMYTDTGSENTSDVDTYEKHFSGLKGGITRQQLIEQERALWLEDYFSRIFMDIDSVLASLIYNREHRYYPYYPTGFGYYSI